MSCLVHMIALIHHSMFRGLFGISIGAEADLSLEIDLVCLDLIL